MSTVSFVNPGIIDYRCITTAGASIKEGDSPIGFFGTGLKYAISIILRHSGAIDIYRGKERLAFTTKQVKIRGKDFPVVCMNGKEMGFTTELGKTWKMWMAFRELYCNALDEKGQMVLRAVDPKPGYTTVVVQCAEFESCARDTGEYVIHGNPMFKYAGFAELYDRMSSNVFYRGIRVQENLYKPYRYTPNILGHLELTEDRTVKNSWLVDECISRAILACEDVAFLQDWLTVGEDYMEHAADLNWSPLKGSVALKVARGLFHDPMTYPKLNRSVRNWLKHEEGEPEFSIAVLLPPEKKELADAIEFCKELTYTVDEYPIVIAETLGENVLGAANTKSKKIYIARQAVAQGKLCLAATLIEEWCHIKHHHTDCSRGMQNWLFENLTRLGAAYLMEKESK